MVNFKTHYLEGSMPQICFKGCKIVSPFMHIYTYWQNSIGWDFGAGIWVILILIRLFCSEVLSIHFERMFWLYWRASCYITSLLLNVNRLFHMQKIPVEGGQQ